MYAYYRKFIFFMFSFNITCTVRTYICLIINQIEFESSDYYQNYNNFISSLLLLLLMDHSIFI